MVWEEEKREEENYVGELLVNTIIYWKTICSDKLD